MSERRVNRTTSVNLERTTATIDELANQMWSILQSIVSSLLESETRQEVQATREAAQQIQDKLPESEASPELKQALQEFSDRLRSVESRLGQYSLTMIDRLPQQIYSNTVLTSMLEKIAYEFARHPEMTIRHLGEALSYYHQPEQFNAENWIEVFQRLADWRQLTILAGLSGQITDETLLQPGEQLEAAVTLAKRRIATAERSFPWNQ